jgi:transcription elongation factor Elf1
MKQKQAYVLDLTKMDGSGNFACPHCGAAISPDDCTEEVYSILDIKVNSYGLSELVIRCNRCESHIHLTGFSLLQKITEIGNQKRKHEKEEPMEYIMHM